MRFKKAVEASIQRAEAILIAHKVKEHIAEVNKLIKRIKQTAHETIDDNALRQMTFAQLQIRLSQERKCRR